MEEQHRGFRSAPRAPVVRHWRSGTTVERADVGLAIWPQEVAGSNQPQSRRGCVTSASGQVVHIHLPTESLDRGCLTDDAVSHLQCAGRAAFWGPIYKISYDLSYDYRKFIVRSTYDSDLKPAEISLIGIS